MFDNQPTTFTYRAMKKYGLLAVLILVSVFFLPVSNKALAVYHVSTAEYKIILFSIILPLLLVWLAAFYGYAKLQEYAFIIRKSPEAKAFRELAKGAKWLAWSLVVPAIIGILLGAIASQWESFYTASRIITNYLNLLLPLVGFSLIAKSSSELINLSKIRIIP